MTRRMVGADLLCLVCAAIWGSAFAAQKLAMVAMPPVSFTGIRYCIGAAAIAFLLPVRRVFGLAGRIVDPAAGRHARDLWIGGLSGGMVMFVGSVLQQVGIEHTSTGNAGFLTSVYVVGVPLLGLFAGQRPGWAAWLAVTIAVPGLWFISMSGRPHIEAGDPWILACAVMWACHVQIVARFATRSDPIALSVVQFAVTGIASLILAPFVQSEGMWTGLSVSVGPLLYCALLSTGVAFTLQTVAQRDAPPTHAAILLSLEGLFAAVTGWFWFDEALSTSQYIGAALLLSAAVLAQVPNRAKDLKRRLLRSPVT
ncbi:MAG: DMT family transporter [Planctomycetota bacterium]|nr:DMT family transporter [Planctomycetota bacterium]